MIDCDGEIDDEDEEEDGDCELAEQVIEHGLNEGFITPKITPEMSIGKVIMISS